MVKAPALREYITCEDVYHPEQINELVILALKNITADSYQRSHTDVFDNYQALNYAIRKYMSYLS